MTIDQRVENLKSEIEKTREMNDFIEEYKPFIIARVSKSTNKYVRLESDESFLIGLEAFHEAIGRYDSSKGHFLGFAELTIHSRVTDWIRKEKRHDDRSVELPDELLDSGKDIEKSYVMKEEILEFKRVMALFGITFNDLVEKAPKKDATRRKVNTIGKRASDDQGIVNDMFRAYVLPMMKITRLTGTTKRVLKTHRDYLISVIVAYVKKLTMISEYILVDRKGD